MNEEKVTSKMQSVLEIATGDISSIRTGRATGALVENILIPVYGGAQKLTVQELGTIGSSDPQTITIEPWDKSIIGEIRKGLMAANLGLNPSIDGEILRLSFPPLTTEDREKYVKLLSTKLENARVMIRQIRGDEMRDIKEVFEKKESSEDEKFRQEKRLQELTDQFVEKINTLGSNKEKEILGTS